MLDLGDKVKDKITGYTGIVTSRTNWLNGCARLGVQTTELKDGKPQEAVVFDEIQLELIEANIYKSDQRVDQVASRELGMVHAKAAQEFKHPERQTGGPRDTIQRPDIPPMMPRAVGEFQVHNPDGTSEVFMPQDAMILGVHRTSLGKALIIHAIGTSSGPWKNRAFAVVSMMYPTVPDRNVVGSWPIIQDLLSQQYLIELN